jgi:hypothetical protein
MTLLIGIFTIFFVGGPVIFRALTQPAPSRGTLYSLIVFAVVFGLFGFGLRYGFAELWGRNTVLTVGCILALWFAWVGVLALGAQALRQAEPGLHMRRWTAILGAAGTTVPWFGLASASVLAG